MSRLVILMVLGPAFTATLGEAKENHIHVTAQVVQQTFTGDLAHPQLSDQLITSVVLRNEDDEEVGTGTGACSVVSVPPLATRLQCLLTAVFANGEIIFGGVAPLLKPTSRRTSASWAARMIFAKPAVKRYSPSCRQPFRTPCLT